MASSGNAISRMNGKPRELNQGGTGTTETAFTTDGTIPVVLPIPPLMLTGAAGATSGVCTKFKVAVRGRVVTGTTANFTATLYYGISATLSANTAASSPVAVSLASLTTNWSIDADCTYDGSSGRINITSAQAAIHTTTSAFFTTAITGVTSNNTTLQGFVVSGTFGTGNASNTAYLDTFEIIL